jgi:hypothetical protein
VQVGDRYYGRVTAENVDQLIGELRGSHDNSPAALADKIVKVHIPGAGENLSGRMEI